MRRVKRYAFSDQLSRIGRCRLAILFADGAIGGAQLNALIQPQKHMYHPRKSSKTPRGYTYAAQVDPSNFTYAVNHIVPNFPTKLDAYIRKWQKETLGIPLPVSRVRESINGSPFHPSVLTEAEDADLLSPGRQMRDDVLKLMLASQDPRFEGKELAIGNDGLLRPISSVPQDPHVFEIVPTVSSTRSADGTVSHDDRIMYVLTDDAEAALEQILEPYGRSAAWYLDGLNVKSPGPWAYVCLRQEYNIAGYLIAQRNKIGNHEGFQFTFYDTHVDTKAPGFVPKVGCLAFYSKAAVEDAANVLAFLRPAWTALREKPAHQHWLIVLNEEPALVLAEAGQRP